jgi:hypothetical protein
MSAGTVVVPFDPCSLPRELDDLVSPAVRQRWGSNDRSRHDPHLVAVVDEGRWVAVALVTARPGTSSLKIVDAVGDVVVAAGAVVDRARAAGLALVKWEGWTVSEADALAAGFRAMRPPLTPGERVGALETGYLRWLGDVEPLEPPYYRQSTDFSCGAVAALVAQVQAGALAASSVDREAELTLWRSATNFPACEPVGLAVAMARAWPGRSVAVALDVDRPVLIDSYSPSEREWRAVLQHVSRAEAAEEGVALRRERLSMDDLRTALASGEQVLLLISLERMLGFDVPHWVLCHGGVDGAIVIDDPWVHTAAGETWVDAHLIPVADASLDEMSSLESDGFRGAVRVGMGASVRV